MFTFVALISVWGSVSASSLITSKATLTAPTTSSSVSASSCSDVAFDCNRDGPYGPPEILEGEYNIYEYEYYGSVASICSASFDSSLSAWEATAPITTFSYPVTGDFGLTSAYTTEHDVAFVNSFSFSAASPCCGNCSLYGGDVQVYYWPTPAPTPAISRLINADNFTFVSPSIYVAFNSLYATDLCGHLAKDISRTTLAFEPGQLSTALAYHYQFSGPDEVDLGNNFTMANFADEPKDCANITTSFIINNYDGSTYPIDQPLPSSVLSFCSVSVQYCDINSGALTYNPCSPTLSVPSQIFTLNPEWKSCLAGIDAFFDPPYTLTHGNGLTAFDGPASTTATPSPSMTAQPQTTPIAPTPTPTPVPTPSPSPSPPPSPIVNSSPSPNKSPSPSPSPNQKPSASPDPSPNNSASPSPSPSQKPSPSPDPSPNNSPSPIPSPSQKASPSPSLSPSAVQQPPPSPKAPTSQSSPSQQPQSQPKPAGSSPVSSNSPVPSHYTTLVPFVAGTQTITPGSPAAVVSGTTYSVPLSGSVVVIYSSTTRYIALSAGTTSDPTPTFVLESQTLVAGGPAVTISSSVIVSLLSGGQSVVVKGSSTTQTLAVTSAFTSSESVVTPSGTGIGGIIISIGGFTTPITSVNSGTASSTSLVAHGVGSRRYGGSILNAWCIGAGTAIVGILIS